MSINKSTFVNYTTLRIPQLFSSRSLPFHRLSCCVHGSSPGASSTISHLAQSIRSASLTASDNLNNTLQRIAEVDQYINAFLTIDVERLQKRAAFIDEQIRQGREVGPLAGVPVAVKDNICTKHLPTTAASRILDGFLPSYDATAVARLEAAGAIILGKTNLDEFGMGSSTESSAYAITRNPCNLAYVPGGSSGGSAAAVAAGMCPIALGTDTGGSIRQPAAFCGVTGIRPSYGRVSRYGLLAYASSFDVIGPIAASVADAALVLGIIAGRDSKDATSVDIPVPDYPKALGDSSLSSLRIGVVTDALGHGVDPSIVTAVRDAVQQLAQLGADVEEVPLPHLDTCVSPYYVLAMSEASANLARYDGIRYGVRNEAENCSDLYARSRASGFGAEVKRRIMAGTFSLSSGYYDAYYLHAQRVRRLIADEVHQAFSKGFHVLITPVTPTPPFRIGEHNDDPLFMYLNDIMNLPSSLTGIPSVSVPCGLTPNKLPIGLQIMAPYMADDVALRVGHAFQEATSHHKRTNELVEQAITVST